MSSTIEYRCQLSAELISHVRGKMDDRDIDTRLREACHRALETIVDDRGFFATLAISNDQISLYKTVDGRLWVPWRRVCKIAKIKYPDLEGRALDKRRMRIEGEGEVTCVVLASAYNFLLVRRVRKEAATPAAHMVMALAAESQKEGSGSGAAP